MVCHALLQGIFPTQGWNHVSCGSRIAVGLFIAKPLGKANVGNWESELKNAEKVKVAQSCLTLCDTKECPHSLVSTYSPQNSPGQNTEVGSCSLLQGICPTLVEPKSPTLQADSLPAEPSGRPQECSRTHYSLVIQG